MIAGLKPYPVMKDSGVEWLGEVPAHWDIRNLRQCAGISGGMTPSMEVARYWNGTIPWVTPKDMKTLAIGDSRVKVTRAAVDETSLRVIGDPVVLLVVRGMILARKVPIAWTRRPLTINQDMKAITPSEGIDARYLAALLDSARDAFFPLIDEAGHGTKRLPTERLRNIFVTVPPLHEQTAIVRYLDHVDRRVRRLVRAKRKLIALLAEQKQAIIHRAVTRGLDPDVPLKDSGVEWLGEVPAHWGVRRLKQVTTPIEQGWSPQCDAQEALNGDWGVLKVGCVNRDDFDVHQNKRLPKELEPREDLQIRDGDILVSRANTRELLGLAALVVNPRPRILLCDNGVRLTELGWPEIAAA